MSYHNHLNNLKERYNALKENIREAYLHYLSDDKIKQMKRQKLTLKEEIENFLSKHQHLK